MPTARTFTAAEMRAQAEVFDNGDWLADIRPSAITAAMLRQAADADSRWAELKAFVAEMADVPLSARYTEYMQGTTQFAQTVRAEMARIEGGRV